MRKKFISLALALIMVLSLLPVPALAADLTDDQKAALEEALLAQEYTEKEIKELLAEDKILVIDEDTELDEDFDGLVIVLSGCTLTVKGAKIGAGVVILPGAEEDEAKKDEAKKDEAKEDEAKETKVVVSKGSEVGAVVVLGKKAEVVVEAEAKVVSIVVSAPEAAVTVEGTVEKLTVDAADVSVTVEAGAKVEAVVVGEDAKNTEITASKDAEMGEVKDESGNAAVTEKPAEPEENKDDKKEPTKTPAEEEFVFDFIFIPDVIPSDPGWNDPNAGGGTTCCPGGANDVTGSNGQT